MYRATAGLQPRESSGVYGVGMKGFGPEFPDRQPPSPVGDPMKRTRQSGSMSLWSIIESLQQRLERQGLARDVIDAAVVTTLAQAMNGAARA